MMTTLKSIAMRAVGIGGITFIRGWWKCHRGAMGVGLTLLLLPGIASTGEPTDQVKETVDKVIGILKDPALKGPAKIAERRAKIRRVVKERFDFAETAKRSLGTHWAQRTPKEQEEFVDLFWDLFELSYVDKVETYNLMYLGESVEGDFATVRSKIEDKKDLAFPIEYRLLKTDGRWLVYDVAIEGVSLISNYQTQFNKIIRISSYEELIRRMRAKLEDKKAQLLADFHSQDVVKHELEGSR